MIRLEGLQQINMAVEIYNVSYGKGLEGLVNWTNIYLEGWFVVAFTAFIWIVTISILSKREERQFPMSAIVAFSALVALITLFLFKLMTSVSEYLVFLAIVVLAGAIAWGLWQAR